MVRLRLEAAPVRRGGRHPLQGLLGGQPLMLQRVTPRWVPRRSGTTMVETSTPTAISNVLRDRCAGPGYADVGRAFLAEDMATGEVPARHAGWPLRWTHLETLVLLGLDLPRQRRHPAVLADLGEGALLPRSSLLTRPRGSASRYRPPRPRVTAQGACRLRLRRRPRRARHWRRGSAVRCLHGLVPLRGQRIAARCMRWHRGHGSEGHHRWARSPPSPAPQHCGVSPRRARARADARRRARI
mmetsp:Transcript_98858/g.247885  ORF Transcript_98858/g.247885 Transcript_98858/m.247885 type:complete len:242 (+) Transcript_98858:454-1179(+)